MKTAEPDLTAEVKKVALAAGADIVGIASLDRFDKAPPEVHPASIFAGTRSVIAVGCRMVRGALKTIEDGTYWQAYNCDSYQYLNEILAPHLLRKIAIFLEDHGWTAVPIHNPFFAHAGRAVRPGGTRPDGIVSLRVAGCAAGLGELGLSKLLLTPEFGPRQRIFVVFTDAALSADPLVEPGSVCDNCGLCLKGCPADAFPGERSVRVEIDDKTFSHAPLDCDKCTHIHQGWDRRYSPFLKEDSCPDNPPEYYRWLDKRFAHLSTCGARGCVRACMDHLEKTGRISKTYRSAMIEKKQWVLDELPS